MSDKCRNAFYFFMRDFKRKEEAQGRKFPNGLKDVQADPKCNEIWRAMTDQQKGEYRSMAKDSKIAARKPIDKKTCTGESIAEIERVMEEERLFQETMTKYIMSTVPISVRNRNVVKTKFYLMHANHFCVRQVDNVTFDYFPAEFAIMEFSLEDGVGDVYHEIINTSVPIGFHREAIETSQQTHQIPLNLVDGEKDFLVMYNKLEAFLKSRMIETKFAAQSPMKFPPLFVTDSVIPMVKSLLRRMTEAADADPDTFLIYSLDMLFSQLLNASCLHIKEGRGVIIPLQVAKREFAKDPLAYTLGLECIFHKCLDGTMVYCSMAVVKRWGFVICDYCCDAMGIEMIPGKHVPLKKTIEEADLDMSLARMTLSDFEPVPRLLSMTGVSEEHRIRTSERTYREEQDRRRFCKPVQITYHGRDDNTPVAGAWNTEPVCEKPHVPKSIFEPPPEGLNIPKSEHEKAFPPLGRGARPRNKKPSVSTYPRGKGRGCF